MVKIYYDADCKICNTCKNLVLKLEKSPDRVGGEKFEFLDIKNSIYKNEIKKTIVVTKILKKEKDKEKEFKFGQAMQEIFKKLIFPFNLFGYLPEFLLTFFT